MDLNIVRPALVGAVAGLLTLYLLKKMARFVPESHGEKDRKQLVADHHMAILTANSLFFLAIVTSIYLYNSGALPRSSWAHFCLIFGIIVLAPAGVLLLSAVGKGRTYAIEAVVAFAIAQKTPLFAVGLIFILGVISLAGAVGYLLGS